MTRSWHTDPPRIRGPRRVAAPFTSRGVGDPAGRYRVSRSLKLAGLLPEAASEVLASQSSPLPRITATRPDAGSFHPATRAQVAALLRLAGPSCTYGLRSVELSRRRPNVPPAILLLGELRVPGRILLYEQPFPPWTLLGRLPQADADRLTRAGATVEWTSGGLQTVVNWPGSTLAEFMLFDVLLHEVAHHLVQQYTGKRTAEVARHRDHEAFAERFVRRCRKAFRARLLAGPE